MYILLSTDFEADLQEVWSVRKNIHHTGQMLPRAVPSSVQVTAAGGQYSRHGAIPAQQSMQGHQALGTKDNSIKGACSIATFPGSSPAVGIIMRFQSITTYFVFADHHSASASFSHCFC